MPKFIALLLVFMTLSFAGNIAVAADLPALFSLELKREFSAKWSTLALEVVKREDKLTSEILILSQSVATIWVDEKPAYMVIELYHVHENNMPIMIRLYSKKEHLPLNPDVLPEIKLNGKTIAPQAAFEYCPKGHAWSGLLSADTVSLLISATQEKSPLTVSLALLRHDAITGAFFIDGLGASYQAGFDWKLHYRPYWEATRLGRSSLPFNQ